MIFMFLFFLMQFLGSKPQPLVVGPWRGTAWTGLALMSKTTVEDPVWPGANPMSLSGQLPADDTYCMPQQQLPESSISDKACMWK